MKSPRRQLSPGTMTASRPSNRVILADLAPLSGRPGHPSSSERLRRFAGEDALTRCHGDQGPRSVVWAATELASLGDQPDR